MRIEVQHPAFITQRLSVETAATFRGPRLLLNGAIQQKQKGRYMVKADSGAETAIQLKYNFFDPIPKLVIGGEMIELAKPLTWYQYAWIGIPIVMVLAGGAVGGFMGAVAANVSGRIFRNDSGQLVKYCMSALVSLGALIAYIAFVTVFQLITGIVHH